MNAPQVSETTIGRAWAAAVEYLLSQPSHEAVNLVVKIASPLENPDDTALIDELAAEHHLPTVATVANTLFPRRLARRSSNSTSLVERYRHILPRIRRAGNPLGTYFARMTTFGSASDPIDQLTGAIGKLREAHDPAIGAMSSRYELAIYDPAHDRNKMRGFPCLSFLSFHLHDGRLHLAAHYRNHYYVKRAYGNYVALGALLMYVAEHASWPPGEIVIVSGKANLELGSRTRILRLIGALRQPR